MKKHLSHVKLHIKKALGRTGREWDFHRFEDMIDPKTKKDHGEILQWAQDIVLQKETIEKTALYEQSEDPIVRQGYTLKKELLNNFQDKYKDLKTLRIMIHVPTAADSIGGHSLFMNLCAGLSFCGIATKAWTVHEDLKTALDTFKPTVLMTGDIEAYLSQIDWDLIAAYRKTSPLRIGLTASLEEYGNTPLRDRLRWAKDHAVSFYFSFKNPRYLELRPQYRPYAEAGYRIASIEFGANVLQYYPVPGIQRDLPYVFLASSNPEKWQRYFEWLPEVLQSYPGFLDGPGWSHCRAWSKGEEHRYLYARAKVGLNLHIPNSIEWPGELNERVYILGACGVPQLTDNAMLLPVHFRPDALFIASDPKQYAALFKEILHDPKEAQKRALIAQQDIFGRHTSLHRAQDLIEFIKALPL